jgi:hypothetical protein
MFISSVLTSRSDRSLLILCFLRWYVPFIIGWIELDAEVFVIRESALELYAPCVCSFSRCSEAETSAIDLKHNGPHLTGDSLLRDNTDAHA